GGSAPSAGMKPAPQEVATGCVPQVVAPAGVSCGAGFIPASGGGAEVRVGGSAPSAGMKPAPQEVATGYVPQVVAPAGVSCGAGFIPASGGGADARVGQPAPHGGDVRIIRALLCRIGR